MRRQPEAHRASRSRGAGRNIRQERGPSQIGAVGVAGWLRPRPALGRVLAAERRSRERPIRASRGHQAAVREADRLPANAGVHFCDAALAILTVHHWTDAARGLAELRRVAERIVILTTSAEQINRLWLTAEYFPGSARVRRPDIQPGRIAATLGGDVRIETVPVPHGCADGFGEAYWGRPEAYLDPGIRAGMSACSLRPRSRRECPGCAPTWPQAAGMSGAGTCASCPSSTPATGHRLIVAA